MCPDIETYAPLINADFGLGDVVHGAHPAHRLRVRLADRSLIQTNAARRRQPAAGLAGSRVTASEVLNLAQAPPVGRGSASATTTSSITRWVRQANIRWGFDQEHHRAVRRRLRPQHMAFRHRPGAGRGGDVRRLARVDRLDAALTTSAATASSWPASSPNTSTGCSGRSARSTARRGDWLTALADGIGLLWRRRQRRLADQPDAARVRRRARDGRPA